MGDQIRQLLEWRDFDEDIRLAIKVVLKAEGCVNVQMLADLRPEVFDDLYETCEAMVGTDPPTTGRGTT